MLSGVAPSTIGTLEISAPVLGSIRISLLAGYRTGRRRKPPPDLRGAEQCAVRAERQAGDSRNATGMTNHGGAPIGLADDHKRSVVGRRLWPAETPRPPSPPYRTGWASAIDSAVAASIHPRIALTTRLFLMHAIRVILPPQGEKPLPNGPDAGHSCRASTSSLTLQKCRYKLPTNPTPQQFRVNAAGVPSATPFPHVVHPGGTGPTPGQGDGAGCARVATAGEGEGSAWPRCNSGTPASPYPPRCCAAPAWSAHRTVRRWSRRASPPPCARRRCRSPGRCTSAARRRPPGCLRTRRCTKRRTRSGTTD